MSKDRPKKDFSVMTPSEIKSAIASFRSAMALETLKMQNAPAGADLSVFKKARKNVARSLTALRAKVGAIAVKRR